MNKELEALGKIKETITSSKLSDSLGYKYYLVSDIEFELIKKHFDIIEEALKRNEPMKVDLDRYITNTPGCFVCPKCQCEKIGYEDEYCCSCGQKLDWSNDEKTN